jgi:hypothetical protein
MYASPLLILRGSRMRKRACTALCGGRSVMIVPTATVENKILSTLVAVLFAAKVERLNLGS